MFKNSTHNLKNVSYFEIVYNGSAAIEKEGYTGISHIIEHCMCEKVKELEKQFKKDSISWNACTSNHQVKFFICGMYDKVKKYKDLFIDKVLNYTITKDVFERERNIIIAEYYQTFSDQTEAFICNWYRKHYNFASAIGIIDDIKNLTYENFIEYKNKNYNIPSYIGYIHPKKKADIIKLKRNIEFNNIKEYSKFNEFGNYSNYKMEHCADFNAQRIIANIINCKLSDSCKEHVYFMYLSNILCGGLTSPLYKELRENLQGVYSMCPCIDILDRNNFIAGIFVFADNTKYTKIYDKFKEMMNNVLNYINEDDFNIVVEEYKNKYKLQELINYKKSDDFNEITYKVKNIIMNKEISYKEFINYIKNIDFNYFYIDNEY